MNAIKYKMLALVSISLVALDGCTSEKNFGRVMTHEISSLGGKTNGLPQDFPNGGQWSISRDKFGEAIRADGIKFETVTNYLTAAYGDPKLYLSSTNGAHGKCYAYPVMEAGITIFVTQTSNGVDIDLSTIWNNDNPK